VIHATRSGIPGNDDWYSTVNWFANPASQVSAHLLIARDGRVGRFVDDEDTAWHCAEHNPYTLGVELEQPTIDTPFTEIQYVRLAEEVHKWRQKFGPLSCIGHEGTPQGIRTCKTDPGPLFDFDHLTEVLNMTPEEKLRLACLELAQRWAAMIHLGQAQQVVNEAKAMGVVAK
jgi:N-acetyl-anhydromuramyl-L-alanine amidase AmpD